MSAVRIQGEKYQGRPCALNHSGLRYRSTRGCVECATNACKKWRLKRREPAHEC